MAPTLASIRSALQNYNPVSRVSGDFKAFLEATVFLDPLLSDEYCIKQLQEDFRVEHIYNYDILRSATIVYRVLRYYLYLKGKT